MYDFSSFNKNLTPSEQAVMDKTRQSIINGGTQNNFDYPEPIPGLYRAQLSDMYLAPNKKTQLPCFYLTFTLIAGFDEDTQRFIEEWPGKNYPKVFMKRPVCGTRNDGACLGSVTGLVSRLHETMTLSFNGDYNQLAEDIEAIKNLIDDTYAYRIEYTPNDFIKFRITEIERAQGAEGQQAAPQPQMPKQTEADDRSDMEPVFQDGYIAGYKPVEQQPTSLPVASDETDTDGFIKIDMDDEEELPF